MFYFCEKHLFLRERGKKPDDETQFEPKNVRGGRLVARKSGASEKFGVKNDFFVVAF